MTSALSRIVGMPHRECVWPSARMHRLARVFFATPGSIAAD
jgi:hypothetical protein